MNEIKHIHLGRQQFTVSLEAYGELRSYLAAITKQVGDSGPDVADEVEMRMAELLYERGITGDKVVLPADVAYLKEQLGEPHDFTEEDEPARKASPEEPTKRLFRDTDHALIAGVAAGLANYLSIDATIVRIIFIVLTFFGGSGVLVYLILWLIVPEARTSSERLQMRGKAVTVDTLKEVVNRVDVPGAAQRAGGIVGRVLEVAAKSVLAAVGGILAFASAITLLSLLTATILLLTHHGKVAGEVFFPIGVNETWALLTAVASAAIIFLCLMLVGISMVRRKWPLPGWGVAALFGLLFITAPIAGALTADIVPNLQHRFDGLHHTQTKSVTTFKNLDVNGADTRFIFVPDTKYQVVYKYLGKANLSSIRTSVSDDTLHIDSNHFDDHQLCGGICLYSGPDLRIEIHAPQLDHVTVSGDDANFMSNQSLRQQSIVLDVASNSFVDLDYSNAVKAVLQANGSGVRHMELTLQNQADKTDGVSMDDEGGVAFMHVDELDFTTNRSCDESDPYVFLTDAPSKLTVNGKAVDGNFSSYSDLRTQDKPSDLNCLDVQASDLKLQPVQPPTETPRPPVTPVKA